MAATTLPSLEVIHEKQRRLGQLELQQARQGIATPPHVTNEIQDLRRDLAAAAPATVAESHDSLYAFMERIEARIDRLYWWALFLALVIILAVKL